MNTPFIPTAQEKVEMQKSIFVAKNDLDIFHFFFDFTYVSERYDPIGDITFHDLARWYIHEGKVCHGVYNWRAKPHVLPQFVQECYRKYLNILMLEDEG